mmetsp:Transcript_36819/g.98890  ORF Transcript_36819/g.98890 Transcript_36819/m.98890 type:complete len:207 (-) Transcript_36819:148-768(-)
MLAAGSRGAERTPSSPALPLATRGLVDHIRSHILDLIIFEATSKSWHRVLPVRNLSHYAALLEATRKVRLKSLLPQRLLGVNDVVASGVARRAVGGEDSGASVDVSREGRRARREDDHRGGKGGGRRLRCDLHGARCESAEVVVAVACSLERGTRRVMICSRRFGFRIAGGLCVSTWAVAGAAWQVHLPGRFRAAAGARSEMMAAA